MADKANWGPSEEFDLHLAYTEDPEDVLPTRLGNVLRAAELYPLHRYGIDIAVLWTRLTMLLPDQLQRDIERSVMQYRPLVISAWSLTLTSCSLTLAWSGQAVLFMSIYFVSCLTGIGGYYLALRPAEHSTASRCAQSSTIIEAELPCQVGGHSLINRRKTRFREPPRIHRDRKG